MSTVLRPNEKPRAVKNLGWLLRHWDEVSELGFSYDARTSRQACCDGNLWAKLRDGTTYITDFACLTIAWRWLNRPVFRGLPFTLTIPDRHDYSPRKGMVGDAQWLEIQKLGDSGLPESYRRFCSVLGIE